MSKWNEGKEKRKNDARCERTDRFDGILEEERLPDLLHLLNYAPRLRDVHSLIAPNPPRRRRRHRCVEDLGTLRDLVERHRRGGSGGDGNGRFRLIELVLRRFGVIDDLLRLLGAETAIAPTPVPSTRNAASPAVAEGVAVALAVLVLLLLRLREGRRLEGLAAERGRSGVGGGRVRVVVERGSARDWRRRREGSGRAVRRRRCSRRGTVRHFR
jgi:hypothetical protein